jgi:hypothetical protein
MTNEPGSYITFFPFFPRQDAELTEWTVIPSPWGAPLLMGNSGRTQSGEPILWLVNETPINFVRPTTDLPKPQVALLHIQRLAVDYRLATGGELYDATRPTSSPAKVISRSAGNSPP